MARRVVKKGKKSGSAKTRNKNCASLDEDTPSQFAPKTPDQSNKVEKRQRATRESDEMEKEVNTSSVEVEELHHEYDEQKQRPKDLSGAVVPTQLQENHSPGTPQQKPQRKLRRKKHRPKVVIDCQKKKTRKVVTQKSANTKENPSGKRKYTRKNKLEQTPATPKPTDAKPPTGKRKYERKKKLDQTPVNLEPADPKETPTVKRKYVRKKKLDQTPVTPMPADINKNPTGMRTYVRKNKRDQTPGTPLVTNGTTDPEPEERAAKSCRRLNFDIERQAREESYSCELQSNSNSESHAQSCYTRVESESNVQFGRGTEVMVEKTPVGIADDLSHSMNKVVQDYISVPERQVPSPQTPTKTDPPHESSNTPIQNEHAGEQSKRLKTGNSVMNSDGEIRQGHYNSLHVYLGRFPALNVYKDSGIQGICFPIIYKKKGKEKGHISTASSTSSVVTAAEHNARQEIPCPVYNACTASSFSTAQFSTSSTSANTASLVNAQGKQQTFEFNLPLDREKRMTKKRSKTPTRIAKTRAKKMTTKKRTKRNYFSSTVTTDVIQRSVPPVDEIVEQLKSPDITSREPSAPVPFKERGALVLYQRGGAVVPFEGSFDPARKLRQRTKVENRVLKLLVENINDEGHDETDEAKAKWWENEQRVFQGRADSFIARMRLVQGDRHFSPWKGSVLDSVVGVFLTQNVSDHLSSSAFMSLAAKFPPKSKSKARPCFEETSALAKESEFKSNEFLGSRSGSEESIDSLKCKSSDIPANGQEMYDKSTAHRAVTRHKEPMASLMGDKKEMDHGLSSQNSGNNPENTECKEAESGLNGHGTRSDRSKVKRGRTEKPEENAVDWDRLRLQAQEKGKRERTPNTMDSLDWEAVRLADVNEIADVIKKRGMNNRLAKRIQDFLNRLVRDHGSIDLEWLRDVPPEKVKEYLLSIKGLGLKSTECVRLLTLHHLAFPVDTNVGRIAVRLGWVPLKPLPESLQLHLLELYPMMESIQKYMWPRLSKLDLGTLYELHCQMITFGKVFCTKSKPNCNACPMRGECRHFASAFASANLALPAPEEKSIVTATDSKAANQTPVDVIKPLWLPPSQANQEAQYQVNHCEPIIEVPASPKPFVDVPATPEQEQPQVLERDIEDAIWEDPEEIPTIKLNIEEFTQNLQNYVQWNMELQEGDMSKALVALTPEVVSIPKPKLKNVSQLRTEHQVYELPDSHPLLEKLDKREPDDPCSYLFAIWTPGETSNSIQPPERKCSSQEFDKLCDQKTCSSCSSIREANSQTVRGTLLIPCRTAMRGSFPLNGTYFQVNEVFADHESSLKPIEIPRAWIWNLPRRTVYFGTSIQTIFRGLSTESIQFCFWRGFVCVRGFEQMTRAPRPLVARLHFPAKTISRQSAT
ncbi:DNA glycosylase/AP lyase ROS1-like [Actinidia eriantha]|uniref:DNA glycosylase/AP lyase ROS1-like n=1 Tax=Actinidia eriantha TaxID=165200 RepID=UPI002584FFC2|nr:DNA glycosylase/AP lyase ROS1-like [Actinidia eriantha]XP_057498223.1 DNA glycosylase/AP lyase ROS1-like [Actinidia eriantha]